MYYRDVRREEKRREEKRISRGVGNQFYKYRVKESKESKKSA
jgi:hypothetical protein